MCRQQKTWCVLAAVGVLCAGCSPQTQPRSLPPQIPAVGDAKAGPKAPPEGDAKAGSKAPSEGDAKADPKPLPPEVVEAWKDAGAAVGWMHVNGFGAPAFSLDKSGRAGGVPAFCFQDWKENRLAKLPDPGAPFGLDLGFTQVADAGVKELAGLKSLQWLALSSTEVSDAGLKDLASLKSLQSLLLYNTKATDAGVARLQKELPGCRIFR